MSETGLFSFSSFTKWLSIIRQISTKIYPSFLSVVPSGMLLSQPYKDPQRPVGSVGFPLPGVKVEVLKRIEEGDEEGKEELILEKELKERGWEENLVWRGEDEGEGVKEGEEGGIVGTLVVKGDNVFKSYWNRPEEVTAKEFTRSGWFITGDSVSFSPR